MKKRSDIAPLIPSERKFLTVCLNGKDVELTEKSFKKAGLTKRQITNNVKKFRKLEIITNKGYKIKSAENRDMGAGRW